MSSYILLRNNKESGPYSLAGLQQLGLRSNDLVWVEGQSMAWLNPKEILSLKGLVSDTPAASLSAYEPKVEEEKEVQLPVTVEPVVTETKYVRSLDEIKEKYVNDLEQRRKWTNRNKVLFGQLKKVGVYAGLVVVGLLAGFFLTRSGAKKTVITNQESHPPASINTKTEEPVTLAETTIPLPQQETKDQPAERQSVEQETRNQQPIPSKKEEPVLREQAKPVANTEKTTTQKEHLATNASVENISSLVSVKTNDYTVASFGGIRDLVLTVKNDSKYFLDNVVVELQYLKPRDVLLKSEDIKFPSVPPNSTQVVAVKKSNRGVKVAVKIKSIQSKELAGSTNDTDYTNTN